VNVTFRVLAPVVFVPIVSLSGFSGASMSGQLAASVAIDASGAVCVGRCGATPPEG
jgi:hypothetical protein